MIFLKTVLSATAMVMFVASASVAQSGKPVPGERVDGNGMPTTRSTPAEQAQTIELNNQVGVDMQRWTPKPQRGKVRRG